MKRIFQIALLPLVLLFASAVRSNAQCQPNDLCSIQNCLFNGSILNSTGWWNAGYTGQTPPGGFCGTIEGEMWFPVVADTNGAIQITLTAFNCQTGNGLQMALYAECDSTPVACNGGVSGGGATPLVLVTPPVNPGQVYLLMIDGYAGDMCEFTLEVTGLADVNQFGLLSGEIRTDLDLDCEADSSDTPVPGIPVQFNGLYPGLQPGDSLGRFSFYYVDTGAVSVNLPGLNGDLWALCIDTITVNPPYFPDTTAVTFLLQPLDLCTDLDIDLGLPPFFRPCQPAQARISYCNLGTLSAADAMVSVVVPSVLELLSASLPIAGQSGDTLYFDLGELAPLECGSFSLQIRPPCNGSLLGQALCLKAFIFPDTPCIAPLNWSGANVQLSASCLGDTLVQFLLKNNGLAPMSETLEYSIIEDEAVLRSGNFQLDAGQSMVITETANGATWRLETGQEPNAPGFSRPSVWLEGCGGLTPGMVDAFAVDQGNRHADTECRQVIGSYDPNLKVASPAGAGPSRLLKANTPLEYTIHFQNTGTDTAFLVRLADVLPPTLDAGSFRPGASSHPCSWRLYGADTLEVVFSPIMLPDSNVNEPASHGWFEFSIAQKTDLPDGVVLENRAAIYFDYNDPVITDPAWHTIGQLTVSIDNPAGNPPAKWKILGNPATETCTFVSERPVTGVMRFELHDARGRLVRQAQFGGDAFVFHRKGLPAGVYAFRLTPERGSVASGKIVLR
ncbi:MAG: DUF11 domain-containing protein [Saprospirales bacterium]|nr:DUF11 domain-containing protein [Saprospirales bacterium]